MNSDTLDCCCGAGEMREGRHDFMARVGDEIVVVRMFRPSSAIPAARWNTRWRHQERSMLS